LTAKEVLQDEWMIYEEEGYYVYEEVMYVDQSMCNEKDFSKEIGY
jgi:hypothetical protein